jgi:hypothetical protein
VVRAISSKLEICHPVPEIPYKQTKKQTKKQRSKKVWLHVRQLGPNNQIQYTESFGMALGV